MRKSHFLKLTIGSEAVSSLNIRLRRLPGAIKSLSRAFTGISGLKHSGLLVACCLLASCSWFGGSSSEDESADEGVLRANPGQAQWLEKQSMLNGAADLAKVVSGSSILWQASPVSHSHSALFKHANTWLYVNPTTLITSGSQSAFALLSGSGFWRAMRQNNIRGLYLAPVFSSGSVWSGSYYIMDDYDDPVSYQFSEAAGTDKEYFALLNTANSNNAVIGMQIVPSATGIGPDFFLAARNMRHYPGIYCMVEVPESMWEQLPEAKSEWDVKEIDPAVAQKMGDAGLFAAVFIQEAQLHLPGGWAATGEVRGIDGQLRRFAYRYYNNPHRAVLNWGDPSAAGRRIVSGGIVRSVGELGAAFVGASFLPLTGLTPYEAPAPGNSAFEPGLAASSDVAQEIRRYGAWSWNKDRLPLPLLKAYLEQKQDVVSDSLLTTGAGHALITGNSALLRSSLDLAAQEGLDFGRMVHSLPGSDGILYKNGIPESREAFGELVNFPGVSNLLRDGTLQASGATLAAIALGFKPEQDIDENAKLKIQKGHEALAFFLAAQPGMFMIPAHDAVGALPPGWIPAEAYSQPTAPGQNQSGGVSLLGERKRIQISDRGVAAIPTLYIGLDVQASLESSFLSRLGALAAMRDRTGVAGGKYLGRLKTNGRGIVIITVELPENRGILLAATNFSQQEAKESVALSSVPGAGSLDGAKLADPFSGKLLGSAGGSVSFNLPGWACKAVVIQPKGAAPLGEVGLDGQALMPEEQENAPVAGNAENATPDVYDWNWDSYDADNAPDAPALENGTAPATEATGDAEENTPPPEEETEE